MADRQRPCVEVDVRPAQGQQLALPKAGRDRDRVQRPETILSGTRDEGPCQGAYGSNKDVRDFSFGEATATLYQIAQIADIGNQLLRQSNGAAETVARRRLGSSIGLAESNYVV